MPDEPIISTTEAAKRLDINERHLRLLLAEGSSGLRGRKVGRNWIVYASSLKNFTRHPTKGRPKDS